jgi:hypothetical protein
MVVSQAGGLVLTETIRAVGLDRELSAALARWRLPLAIHDPGKIVADLAVTLALGGDCLADIALVRAEPGLYGLVASDPTVSRTIARLADDAPAALSAIAAARAAARARAWRLAGALAPDYRVDRHQPLIVDVDATLVTAHSDKEGAAPTFKRGFGHHPLWSFLDHGPDGTGEPLSVLLRPGNAGSNTAADHVTVPRNALRQLPNHRVGTRPGRKVLIRIDGAGATHELLDWIVGQRMSYSVGFTLPTDFAEQLTKIPNKVWTPAYNSDGEIREGAWVAEITGLLNLDSWPDEMRVIARKERPHPGAQLRITDADGLRVTAFATNTTPGGPAHQLADLELRHPPPGPRRGPHPGRQGNRADQPALARPRPEPDLVRPDHTGPRDHRLDPDARPGPTPSPPLGTQTPSATPVLHRRPPSPLRPPNRAAPGHTLALDRAARRGPHHAARPGRTRLTHRPPAPTTVPPAGQWNRPPSRATSAKPSCPTTRINIPTGKQPVTITQHHGAKDLG